MRRGPAPGSADRRRPRTLRRLGWAVDALLVSAVLAAYAAAYVPPRPAWWIQPLGAGLPFLGAAVVFAAVVSAGVGAWKLFGMHLLLGLMVGARVLPVGHRPEADAGSVPVLRVMTFNAKFKIDVARAYPDRTVDTLLAQEAPDVLALQEAYVTFRDDTTSIEMLLPPAATTLHALGYTVHHSGPAGDRRLLNPVVSRVPLLEQTQHVLPRPLAGERAPTVTRVRFAWQGQDVVLYNVHLKSFSGTPEQERNLRSRLDPRSWPERVRIYRETYAIQAAQVEAIRRMLQQETQPFIVCGDLNSTPFNWAYRRLASGLQDASRMAGRGWGATYHARLPILRIDYILVSTHWRVRRAHVAAPAMSDHRALLVQLTRKAS